MTTDDTDEVTAARALLAHYNTAMAKRLADWAMKRASQAAQKRVAQAVIDQIPKALDKFGWAEVYDFAKAMTAKYIASPGFGIRAQEIIGHNIDRWLDEAIQRVVEEQVSAAVKRYVRDLSGHALMQGIAGKLQVAVDREIEIAAKEIAKAAGTKA